MEQKQLEKIYNLVPIGGQQKKHWLLSWPSIFQNIIDYRFFIYQLIRVDILGEYRRSFIGLFWLFILPVLSVIVWILLNGAGIMDPGDTGIPYPAYVLLSTSIWGFFADIYKTTSRVLKDKGGMMLMTPFPHEVVVVERILVHLIRFSIPLLVNIVVLYLFGVRFNGLALLFPLSLLPLLILGVAIGLVVALIRVVSFDIAKLIDRVIGFMMFLTPIVYAPKIEITWLATIIQYNPLTYLIGFSRELLTQGVFYEPLKWGICSGISIICLMIAAQVFLSAERNTLERLISN